MKITIGKLKLLIKESLDEVSSRSGSSYINFHDYPHQNYDPMTWTSSRMYHSIMNLFQGVGADLNLEIEDPSDWGFIDYCRDTLSDHKVPREVINQVQQRLENRKFGRDDFVPPLNF